MSRCVRGMLVFYVLILKAVVRDLWAMHVSCQAVPAAPLEAAQMAAARRLNRTCAPFPHNILRVQVGKGIEI